jgi:hypothetical protein
MSFGWGEEEEEEEEEEETLHGIYLDLFIACLVDR